MFELVICYIFISAVIFSITKNRAVSLLWPVFVLKFLFEIIQGIINIFKTVKKKRKYKFAGSRKNPR
ncbi:MAG: hypothetical protein FWD87_10415 [Spirochaetaceae bacterium]|nr:hypothetical protein [Spirochaetaceae bacterium]